MFAINHSMTNASCFSGDISGCFQQKSHTDTFMREPSITSISYIINGVHKFIEIYLDVTQSSLPYDKPLALDSIEIIGKALMSNLVRFLATTHTYQYVTKIIIARILAANPQSANVERLIRSVQQRMQLKSHNILSTLRMYT